MKKVTKKAFQERFLHLEIRLYLCLSLLFVVVLGASVLVKADSDPYFAMACSEYTTNKVNEVCNVNSVTQIVNGFSETLLPQLNQSNFRCIEKFNACKEVCKNDQFRSKTCETAIFNYSKLQNNLCAADGVVGKLINDTIGINEDINKAKMQCENFKAISALNPKNNNLQNTDPITNTSGFFGSGGFLDSMFSSGKPTASANDTSTSTGGNYEPYKGHTYVPANLDNSAVADSTAVLDRIDDRIAGRTAPIAVAQTHHKVVAVPPRANIPSLGVNPFRPNFINDILKKNQPAIAKKAIVKSPLDEEEGELGGTSFLKTDTPTLKSVQQAKDDEKSKQQLFEVIEKAQIKTKDPILKMKLQSILPLQWRRHAANHVVAPNNNTQQDLFERVSGAYKAEYSGR